MIFDQFAPRPLRPGGGLFAPMYDKWLQYHQNTKTWGWLCWGCGGSCGNRESPRRTEAVWRLLNHAKHCRSGRSRLISCAVRSGLTAMAGTDPGRPGGDSPS